MITNLPEKIGYQNLKKSRPLADTCGHGPHSRLMAPQTGGVGGREKEMTGPCDRKSRGLTEFIKNWYTVRLIGCECSPKFKFIRLYSCFSSEDMNEVK